MPDHKPLKSNIQRNKASIKEKSTTLSPEKAKDYPASLNGIPKSES